MDASTSPFQDGTPAQPTPVPELMAQISAGMEQEGGLMPWLAARTAPDAARWRAVMTPDRLTAYDAARARLRAVRSGLVQPADAEPEADK